MRRLWRELAHPTLALGQHRGNHEHGELGRRQCRQSGRRVEGSVGNVRSRLKRISSQQANCRSELESSSARKVT